MVSTIEGVIYGGSVLLSTLVGAVGIHVLSRVPGLYGLNHLSTASYALYSTLTGLGFLAAVIIYRWPYMESALTFGQIKGQPRFSLDQDDAQPQVPCPMTSFGDHYEPSSMLGHSSSI
jgi:hypothetical protein